MMNAAGRRLLGSSALIVVAMALTVSLRAETGYDLWLRYVPLADDTPRTAYRRSAAAIVVESQSPTGAAIVAELRRGLQGLLGVDAAPVNRPSTDGAVIVGTPSSSPLVAALGWTDALTRAGHEGYVCLLYTSPSPRDTERSRMPSSA